jgi:hypothetical protein
MLTQAQKTAFKSNFLANTATITVLGGQTVAINTLTAASPPDSLQRAADWYNGLAATDFIVWRDLPMESVLNAITFANMTPADAVPTTPDLAVQVWLARSLSCQGKQFNLQNLINGRTTAPMKKANYRAALQDCLTNLPAGASGALIAANWVGVRDAAKFQARNVEKVLATGTGSSASPADLDYEGTITGGDIYDALLNG